MTPNRPRVFCESLSDWLDDEVPIEWLADLLKLIHDTPNLDWLLLTKRPQNWRNRLYEIGNSEGTHFPGMDYGKISQWARLWLEGMEPDNCWIGTTVEDQTRADQRIPQLLSIPAKVRFLSCEPLLGPVTLPLGFKGERRMGDGLLYNDAQPRMNWVIVGGESGPNARPMHPDWARSLRDQCQASGVAFHFKQWGEFVTEDQAPQDIVLPGECTRLLGAKGPCFYRVSKKAAGRELDGRTWDEFPAV